jgi:UDP-N-acetylglucosamine diphosphorylase / glucose-1-phosphate thymidylyltransferase / UDP-N-acetylgalactosamine diphosphorylase / glucosamine-1-phosphate N-acetyltransferase / galactosamine-1-phosphate N-acetyltransferase
MPKPTVIILAGGSNSRFFPLNTSAHKATIELLGKPIIVRTLENLEQNGFEDIVIVQSERDASNNSLKKTLSAHQLNLDIKLVVQKEPKGMGDAILTAKQKIESQFAVIFPDFINAGDLLSAMIAQNIPSVVCATKTKTPWLYGILEIYNNLATGIIEKPPKGTEKSNQRISGCYLLDKKILSILENLPESEYNFEEALRALMKQEEVGVKRLETSLITLKLPWHLFNYQEILFKNLQSYQAKNAVIAPTAIIDESNGPVFIGEKAKVGDFVKISGPCYVGKNCLVGDYSFIRGSSLEKGSVVGAKTEIARSIIMNNSSIHFGYLADSIIGPNNKIGADLVTANKRLDRQPIQTLIKGIKTNTNRKALGIITGEGVKVGISVKTMPGVLIGAGAEIGPGESVKKNVEHNKE